MMTKRPIYNDSSDVVAEDGVVKVDGPDHVHVDLTPDAALETSDRLLHSSQEARGQLFFKGKGDMPRAGKKPKS